jgi:hypothetical protein
MSDSADSYEPGDLEGNLADAIFEVALDHDMKFAEGVAYDEYAAAAMALLNKYFTADGSA